MYDLLKFIDSPDIREYNKETKFTPAEWAVLVSRSMKRSVEEKMEALEFLAEYYSAEEFREESIWPVYGDPDPVPFRDVVIETVHAWKEALRARFEIEGVVFETYFCEQELSRQGGECRYFSCYEKAWAYLIKEKQEYLDDEDLRSVKTFARINRIKLDHTEGSGGETYNFDNEMRMISVYIDYGKFFAGREMVALADDYLLHVPLPFKKGDIVKVDFPNTEVHYGVFSCDWKKPEDPRRISMYASLEMYIEEDKDFDYTDGDPYWDDVLGFSYCSDEELPESEQVLKLIRAVRKGEMDFYELLHNFGRGDLKKLLKWV